MLNILSSSSVDIFNQFLEGISRERILFGFLQQVQVSLRRGTSYHHQSLEHWWNLALSNLPLPPSFSFIRFMDFLRAFRKNMLICCCTDF
jgi:hypothetical protein